MRKLFLFIALFLSCGYVLAQEKQELKVLFVGGNSDGRRGPSPEGTKTRMAVYETFLKQHFTDVTMVNVADYTESMSYKVDVTIVDADLTPTAEGGEAFLPDGTRRYFNHQRLSHDFNQPMLFIAEAGERNTRNIGSKFDWM